MSSEMDAAVAEAIGWKPDEVVDDWYIRTDGSYISMDTWRPRQNDADAMMAAREVLRQDTALWFALVWDGTQWQVEFTKSDFMAHGSGEEPAEAISRAILAWAERAKEEAAQHDTCRPS